MATKPGKEPEFYYGGKLMVITADAWAAFDTGDEYQVSLAFQCYKFSVECTIFEVDRKTALAAASAELYQLILSHQSRCADCQADIVSGLLHRRHPKKTDEPE